MKTDDDVLLSLNSISAEVQSKYKFWLLSDCSLVIVDVVVLVEFPDVRHELEQTFSKINRTLFERFIHMIYLIPYMNEIVVYTCKRFWSDLLNFKLQNSLNDVNLI